MNENSASDWRAQAARCRRLASATFDQQTRDLLDRSAEQFDDEAAKCEAKDSASGPRSGPGEL